MSTERQWTWCFFMANNYCTSTEIKDAMPDGNWGSDYDTLLSSLATRASRVIDKWTGRKPGAYYVSSDTTYFFDGPNTSGSQIGNVYEGYTNRVGGIKTHSSQLWVGEMADVPTSVSMALSGDITNYTLMSSTDYMCWPYNALSDGVPYLRLDLDMLYGNYKLWYSFPKGIKVVGKFGYSTTVPEDIKQACVIQASRWFKRGQQGFQDTGAVPELGQLKYTKLLDPDVELMLMHYKRVTI